MPPHFADALVQHNAGDQHNQQQQQHHDDAANGQSATDTANAALHYSMTVQQPGPDSFMQEAAEAAQHHREPSPPRSFVEAANHPTGPIPYEFSPLDQLKEQSQQPDAPQQQLPPPQQQQQPTPTPTGPEQSPPVGGTPTPNKPAVGTDAWHKVRKDNHKEGRIRSCRLLAVRVVLTMTSSGETAPRDD